MRIFVTGGAGYVGSACLRHLLDSGIDAVAFDNLSQGHPEAIPQDRLIRGDINDRAELQRALAGSGADAVMHFAAATYVGESVSDPEFHYRNNIGGTLNLLNAMRECKVGRMLFSGTCATYGETPSIPMDEDAPKDPCSPYARTKLAVEWMIRDFAHAYGMGFTILRYFNAAGADPDGAHGEDHRPETHLIPLVIEVGLGRRDLLRVYGDDYDTPDGTCIRDYVHIADLASAHRLAIQQTSSKTMEVLNVGTGAGHSVLEVVRSVERVTGRRVPYEIASRRPGDAAALVSDPKRIRQRLGWAPEYPELDALVESACRWHETHPEGYGPPRHRAP